MAVLQAAWSDASKRGEIHVDIEGNPVHGHAAIHANADRRNLGFVRICNPHARRVPFPMACDPVLPQARDHHFFQSLDVSADTSHMVCQTKDWVHHQLPRSVIGRRSPPVDMLNLNSISVPCRGITAPIRELRLSADGIDRLVLKDEDGIGP